MIVTYDLWTEKYGYKLNSRKVCHYRRIKIEKNRLVLDNCAKIPCICSVDDVLYLRRWKWNISRLRWDWRINSLAVLSIMRFSTNMYVFIVWYSVPLKLKLSKWCWKNFCIIFLRSNIMGWTYPPEKKLTLLGQHHKYGIKLSRFAVTTECLPFIIEYYLLGYASVVAETLRYYVDPIKIFLYSFGSSPLVGIAFIFRS